MTQRLHTLQGVRKTGSIGLSIIQDEAKDRTLHG